jgi:transcriptional regulator with XRE-family HTH domain
MSLIAQNLKQLRLNAGMTQLDYGKKYGLSRFNVSSYEDARAKPPVEVLREIGRDEGLTVESLFYKKIQSTILVNESEMDLPQEIVDLIDPRPIEKEAPIQFPTTLFDSPEPIPDFRALQNSMEPKTLVQESKVNCTEDIEKYSMQFVPMVNDFESYLMNHNSPSWLANLPYMNIPISGKGAFRAFENNYSWSICKKVENWFDLKSGTECFVLSNKNGLQQKIVYNEIKLKGEFLLSSLNPSEPVLQVGVADLIELWQVIGNISYQAS